MLDDCHGLELPRRVGAPGHQPRTLQVAVLL